jgi:acetoin utilization deacetylase AcuC-like enzyme
MLQEIGSELILTAQLAHLAVRHAAWKSFTEILSLGSEAILQLVDGQGHTPAYIAESCKVSEQFEAVKAGQIPLKVKQTLLLTHEACFEHAALPAEERTDPRQLVAQQKSQAEVPHRLEVLVGARGALTTDYFTQRVTLVSDFPEAPIADVLRVHDYTYIHRLQKALNSAEGLEHLDRDTLINESSFEAALVAAGSVIYAVDQVLDGQFTTAFCAVRPPGHHAGPFGEVKSDDPSSSSGFCLLNNVAIGAAYAIGVYRDIVKKVAIVDFDVHHGNGTQAILENLKPNRISNKLHLDFATAEVKTYSYKPWLGDADSDNVRFFSSHGYGRDEFSIFYPASGSEEENKPSICNLPLSYGTRSGEFRKGRV